MNRTLLLAIVALLSSPAWLRADVPSDYKGKPYHDEKYHEGPQSIPGCVECAYYDLGGEGVAYHAMSNKTGALDTKNHGGNELNLDPHHQRPQSSAYYWAFRKNDTLSTSYTKDFVDFTNKNLYQPKFNQLYIGWTADGEWANYTVNVKFPGTYKIFAVYSNKPNTIKFSINHKPAGEYKLPVDTGYYHHWNRAEVGEITFPEKGLQLLTFYFDAPDTPDKMPGNNFAYFEFFPESDVGMANDDKPAPATGATPAAAAEKSDAKAQ